jgi:hypothetical protein
MRKCYRVTREALRSFNHSGKIVADAVVLGDYPAADEAAPWLELTMIWYRGESSPKLECYQDSFAAFEQFRDLFDVLGKLAHECLTPGEFGFLLEGLGFADITPETPWTEILVTLQSDTAVRSVA